MRFRLIRLRFRRRIRKGQQQVEGLSHQAEQHIENHFFRRFGRLVPVRRFVIGWVALVLIILGLLVVQNINLSSYYQTLAAVPGGIYNEGVIGAFTNANPLYATSSVDSTVSKLVFAGLFTYDDKNNLVGDLAKDYVTDDKGVVYTVHLKPNLTWQDGKPLTSLDVLFTYQTIQNPDAQSPLQSSWRDIKVTTPNKLTVVFTLPNPLASFPYSMTNGIVPSHLLAKLPVADLRSADFNTAHPVGAGPFAWSSIQVSGSDPSTSQFQVELMPFKHYQAGEPKLQRFIIHAYATQAQLIKSFKTNQLNGAQGLIQQAKDLISMPGLQEHSLLLSAATMVFFKTSAGVLSDSKVRLALVQSVNVPNIIKQLGYTTLPVREPLLIGQLAYDASKKQSGFDLNAAKATLDADGWTVGKDGIRVKSGNKLTFRLTVADTPEYHNVVQNLHQSWLVLGVQMVPQFLSTADFQGTLSGHDYEAVLYGISIGLDPDVFAYWDSSQADIRSNNRLNLSEYKNTIADASLEAGRTRLNPALRVFKYKSFLDAWQQENPALGLYQPRSLYITNGIVSGFVDHTLNTPTDRFSNVQNWQIRLAKVTN